MDYYLSFIAFWKIKISERTETKRLDAEFHLFNKYEVEKVKYKKYK